MNRLIVFLLAVIMVLSMVGCGPSQEELQTDPDDIRISYDEADEMYFRRSVLFETTAAYIYKDKGGFAQKNQGKDILLQIDMQEEETEMRRVLNEYGFEGSTIDDFLTLIYDEQIQRIVWNSDDSIDYYLYDGYSVICCSEYMTQKEGQLANAHVSSLDKNWFFLEAVSKIQF